MVMFEHSRILTSLSDFSSSHMGAGGLDRVLLPPPASRLCVKAPHMISPPVFPLYASLLCVKPSPPLVPLATTAVLDSLGHSRSLQTRHACTRGR